MLLVWHGCHSGMQRLSDAVGPLLRLDASRGQYTNGQRLCKLVRVSLCQVRQDIPEQSLNQGQEDDSAQGKDDRMPIPGIGD